MRLTKIKLAGFKSFVDPTTIFLPSNLIGIVGPNGCGKSNVIDAVRWVMGESSAKQLRGDSMADVIFNGSTGRKPVGHATIELVFDNSDGTVGGQYASYSEISIKRQVSRDGQSSYFLNGARCRRRDITDVFLGTGLGPRSYSIIEQGMISRIIEARPEDLRIFLEEAAGISKYKERRRETENRIQHTRDNLSRVNDLRDEIEKQLDRLQRQSKAAEKYKELKQEERQVRAELLALRLRNLDAGSAEQERAIQERETRLEQELSEQRAIEAALEKFRDSHIEATDSFNAVQGRFYGVGAEIARLEQSIQHARETRQRQQQDIGAAESAVTELGQHISADSARIAEIDTELQNQEPALEQARAAESEAAEQLAQAEQAMQDWQGEWDGFNSRAAEPVQVSQVERTRIDHLDRQMLQYQQRRDRIDEERRQLAASLTGEEVATLDAQVETLEQQIAERQAAVNEVIARIGTQRDDNHRVTGELDTERSRLQHLKGRLASLEALQQAALGKNPGAVTDWLRGQQLDGAARLAQQISVEPRWERAVETVLGGYLEAVCVDGLDAVADVLGGLEHGTLTLFDTRAISGESTDSGVATPLASHIQSALPLGSLLSGIYAADSLREALALRDRLGAHESVITPEGVWLGAAWLRVSRDFDEKSGVLSREKEIKQLQAEIEAAGEAVARAEAAIEAGRDALRELESQREQLQIEVNQTHRQHADLRAQAQSKRARQEQASTRDSALAAEHADILAQLATSDSELHSARATLSEALTLMETLAGERETLSARRDELRAALDQHRQNARAQRDTVHNLALRIESIRTARQSLDEGLNRMRGQLTGMQERLTLLRAAFEEGEAPQAALADELEAKLAVRMQVEAELGAARRTLEEIDTHLREHEQKRHTCEQQVLDIRSSLEQARLASQESRVRRQTLVEQLGETGFELEDLLAKLGDDAEEAAWQAQVEQIEQRINRLGPINLAAIDEYAEQSERKVYLDAQLADLNEALETLENAIRKIDRETRTRFQETFDRVNTGFQTMFPRLFGGGHAYLELTGEDLLDTGVSVMARPPGKRNSSIHLLSGGEKALTAVALVFSIFELNPSPFCMLDEVDAPLDDANVGRFCDLVKTMSERVQFIFITHNKTTMELANQLTGVTMHEPGVSRLVAVDVDEAAQMAAS